MSEDDWFRVPCLTDEARDQFEQRLKRSRSARAEYMRLQAQALCEAGAFEQAILLLNRILEEHPTHFIAWLYESRAECHRQRGCPMEAIEDHRKSIEAMRRQRGTRSSAPILLAALVHEERRYDLYEECLDYLIEFWEPDPVFPRTEFLQSGWAALLLHFLGKHRDARTHALRAIAAAGKTQSDAAWHPALGLVQDSDRPMLAGHAR